MSNQQLSNPITIRLPADVLEGIEQVASALGRSRSFVMVRALKAYLADEGRDILEIEKARSDLAAGKGVDLDAVLDDIDRLIA